MPNDASIKLVSEGMMPPKVLNSIDPARTNLHKIWDRGYGVTADSGRCLGSSAANSDLRPIGFGLDEKAVEAVKSSRFQPATVNGQPVPVVIDLVVTFRYYSNRTKPGSVAKGSKEAVLAASWPTRQMLVWVGEPAFS